MSRARMRPWSALLGILALLLQMSMPLAHDPMGLGQSAPLLGPLCHAGADGAGSKAPRSDDGSGKTLCQLCLGLAAASSFVSPPALPGVTLAQSPLPQFAATADSPRGQPGRGGSAQPRAPPILA
jgi:hypothetical protein